MRSLSSDARLALSLLETWSTEKPTGYACVEKSNARRVACSWSILIHDEFMLVDYEIRGMNWSSSGLLCIRGSALPLRMDMLPDPPQPVATPAESNDHLIPRRREEHGA